MLDVMDVATVIISLILVCIYFVSGLFSNSLAVRNNCKLDDRRLIKEVIA